MEDDTKGDGNEEKTWVISKKGDQRFSILWPIISIVSMLIIFKFTIFFDINFFDPVFLIMSLICLGLYLLIFYILKATGNWENPKIMTIKNNTIVTEERFPDGEIQRQEVPIDGIYKITMKRRVTLIEYKLPDGREFIWRFIRPGYAREDRKKLKEVLDEILKRVDLERVEGIQ